MTPVVICITDAPEERTRLARLYDGVGVLVMASDPASASAILGHLRACREVPSRAAAPDEVVGPGDLRLDLAHHEASWRGAPLDLTPRELRVLGALARRPGQVWTYQQLHEHAWDELYYAGPAAVQSVIKRLRAKLRATAGSSLQIIAARGVGFRLVEGPRSTAALSA